MRASSRVGVDLGSEGVDAGGAEEASAQQEGVDQPRSLSATLVDVGLRSDGGRVQMEVEL